MTDCFYLIGREQNILALIRCKSLLLTTVKARTIKNPSFKKNTTMKEQQELVLHLQLLSLK